MLPALASGTPAPTDAGVAKVLDRVTQTFPTVGVQLTMTKLQDPHTGRTYLEVRDASGKLADLAKVESAEQTAKLSRSGKIDQALAARVSTMATGQRTAVSIWLKAPDPAISRGGSLDARLDAVQRFVSPYQQRVLKALAQMGASGRAPQYGPAVFADLTPGQIRSIAKRADVDVVYGSTNYSLANDDATTTERANNVWAAGNLGFGTSSRPVIHEPDGVSNYNPYLNNSSHPVIFYCSTVSSACPLGKNVFVPSNPAGTHASSVAGVIASTNGQFRGIAPSSQVVFSANSQDFSDANLVAAFEWARGNGGNPTNMSWGSTCPDGQQNFMSRYVDWAVKNLTATFTISSGNTRGCATRDLQVSSPGVAWGAITVGAIEDDNTGFWTGDSMTGFSRWQNPDFAPGMEKPEVVAVGQDRRTTSDTGITPVGVDGTSFSAPAVAGQVTQMLARRPLQTSWPETNKAAVLASAYHDIVVGTDRDGVGAVVMNNSDDAYRLGNFRNDFGDSTAGSFPKSYPASFTAGQVVRVATAWDAWSTGGGGTDVLGADLDLCVLRNDTGATVACSSSVQNAWERVDFTAPVTGSYTVRVTRFSSALGWPGTFLGTAWSVRSLPTQCSLATIVPSTGASYSLQTNANGGTYLDTYTGWALDQSGRERVYLVSLTTTKDISIADTNPNLDVHIVQFNTCSPNGTIMTVKGNGANLASVNNAPPGRYWMIVDGRDGAVGTTNVTISITGP
jgi:hypothetical protein